MRPALLSFALVACVQDYGIRDQQDPIEAPAPDEDTDVTPEEPIADAPVYAHTRDQLFSFDPATLALVSIGAFHDAGGVVDDMVDIGIDLEGRLFGGSYDTLYRIDPTTAEVTAICGPGVDMVALTFTSDGALVAGGYSEISKIDVAHCRSVPLVRNSDYDTSGDLVGLPDGFLYWTVQGASGDELVRVDPNDGRESWVGMIGVDRLFGLAYAADGKLYGFSDHGEVVRIDPASARAAVVLTEAPRFWGATTNPVRW